MKDTKKITKENLDKVIFNINQLYSILEILNVFVNQFYEEDTSVIVNVNNLVESKLNEIENYIATIQISNKEVTDEK